VKSYWQEEGIPLNPHSNEIKLDCRYLRQYHEVSIAIPEEVFSASDADAIVNVFHAEHNRLYGYSLDQEGVPVEVINVRVQAVGGVEKTSFSREEKLTANAEHAIKNKREIYIPSDKQCREVSVYDGHKLKHDNHIEGPVMIEQITTAIFVGETFNCLVDQYGSFVLYRKDRADLVVNTLSASVGGKQS